ncbi:toxin glutamine deamidase domain-containing protein [Kitasatospora phosalacinea]|uniref:WXG100-like domain-containing protein n=1 Tax=Kitasatospora phosalacinea TaxID=2065 RepID=UPI0035DC6BD1
MAVELPEPLQWVLLLLAGTRWPEADEDQLRDMAERCRKAAEALKDTTQSADSTIKRALDGQKGKAAEALGKHWEGYTVGKGTPEDPGRLTGTINSLNGMGDMLEQVANSAETAKIQIIAQLGILAFELATAEAEAPFTAGASLLQVPVMIAASRVVVSQLLKKLLKETLEMAAKQAAQMGAINLLAQGIEVAEGHRKSIDTKELGQNVLGGAVGGASAHLIGKGIGAAGKKVGAENALNSTVGKMGTGAVVGVGADVSTQLITTGHVEGGSLLGSGLSGGAGAGLHAGASALKGHAAPPPPAATPKLDLPGSSGSSGAGHDGPPTFTKSTSSGDSASAYHGPTGESSSGGGGGISSRGRVTETAGTGAETGTGTASGLGLGTGAGSSAGHSSGTGGAGESKVSGLAPFGSGHSSPTPTPTASTAAHGADSPTPTPVPYEQASTNVQDRTAPHVETPAATSQPHQDAPAPRVEPVAVQPHETSVPTPERGVLQPDATTVPPAEHTAAQQPHETPAPHHEPAAQSHETPVPRQEPVAQQPHETSVPRQEPVAQQVHEGATPRPEPERGVLQPDATPAPHHEPAAQSHETPVPRQEPVAQQPHETPAPHHEPAVQVHETPAPHHEPVAQSHETPVPHHEPVAQPHGSTAPPAEHTAAQQPHETPAPTPHQEPAAQPQSQQSGVPNLSGALGAAGRLAGGGETHLDGGTRLAAGPTATRTAGPDPLLGQVVPDGLAEGAPPANGAAAQNPAAGGGYLPGATVGGASGASGASGRSGPSGSVPQQGGHREAPATGPVRTEAEAGGGTIRPGEGRGSDTRLPSPPPPSTSRSGRSGDEQSPPSPTPVNTRLRPVEEPPTAAELAQLHQHPSGPVLIYPPAAHPAELRQYKNDNRFNFRLTGELGAVANTLPHSSWGRHDSGSPRPDGRPDVKVSPYSQSFKSHLDPLTFTALHRQTVRVISDPLRNELNEKIGPDALGLSGNQMLEAAGSLDFRTQEHHQAQEVRRNVLERLARQDSQQTWHPVDGQRVTDQLDGSTSAADGVHRLLNGHDGRPGFDGIVLGEAHSASPSWGFLSGNMHHLKAAGVDRIYVESLRDDAFQRDLDAYQRPGGTMSPNLEKMLRTYDSALNSPDGKGLYDTVVQAKAAGVTVHAVDGYPARRPQGPQAMEERARLLNSYMNHTVASGGPGKYVLVTGSSHVHEHWTGTEHRIPGVAEMLGVPAVRLTEAGRTGSDGAPHDASVTTAPGDLRLGYLPPKDTGQAPAGQAHPGGHDTPPAPGQDRSSPAPSPRGLGDDSASAPPTVHDTASVPPPSTHDAPPPSTHDAPPAPPATHGASGTGGHDRPHDAPAHEAPAHDAADRSGPEQPSEGVRPAGADRLRQDLPNMSPQERAQELANLTPENRRWLARDTETVKALKEGLLPGEFADTAAQLIVHVDPRAERAPSARQEAQQQVARMLQDPETTARLLEKGADVVIVPKDVRMPDVPELHHLSGVHNDSAAGAGRGYDDMRGSGGRHSAVTEENLLGEHTTIGPDAHYADGYSTTTHEFTHTVHEYGLDPVQQKLITDTFQQKRDDPEAVWPDGPRHDRNGKPVDNYSSRDEKEYFAQLTNAYLGNNHGTDPYTGQPRNNGAAWVKANESVEMRKLLETLYGKDPAEVHSGPANPVRATTAENRMYEGLREFMDHVDGDGPHAPDHRSPTGQAPTEQAPPPAATRGQADPTPHGADASQLPPPPPAASSGKRPHKIDGDEANKAIKDFLPDSTEFDKVATKLENYKRPALTDGDSKAILAAYQQQKALHLDVLRDNLPSRLDKVNDKLDEIAGETPDRQAERADEKRNLEAAKAHLEEQQGRLAVHEHELALLKGEPKPGTPELKKLQDAREQAGRPIDEAAVVRIEEQAGHVGDLLPPARQRFEDAEKVQQAAEQAHRDAVKAHQDAVQAHGSGSKEAKDAEKAAGKAETAAKNAASTASVYQKHLEDLQLREKELAEDLKTHEDALNHTYRKPLGSKKGAEQKQADDAYRAAFGYSDHGVMAAEPHAEKIVRRLKDGKVALEPAVANRNHVVADYMVHKYVTAAVFKARSFSDEQHRAEASRIFSDFAGTMAPDRHRVLDSKGLLAAKRLGADSPEQAALTWRDLDYTTADVPLGKVYGNDGLAPAFTPAKADDAASATAAAQEVRNQLNRSGLDGPGPVRTGYDRYAETVERFAADPSTLHQQQMKDALRDLHATVREQAVEDLALVHGVVGPRRLDDTVAAVRQAVTEPVGTPGREAADRRLADRINFLIGPYRSLGTDGKGLDKLETLAGELSKAPGTVPPKRLEDLAAHLLGKRDELRGHEVKQQREEALRTLKPKGTRAAQEAAATKLLPKADADIALVGKQYGGAVLRAGAGENHPAALFDQAVNGKVEDVPGLIETMTGSLSNSASNLRFGDDPANKWIQNYLDPHLIRDQDVLTAVAQGNLPPEALYSPHTLDLLRGLRSLEDAGLVPRELRDLMAPKTEANMVASHRPGEDPSPSAINIAAELGVLNHAGGELPVSSSGDFTHRPHQSANPVVGAEGMHHPIRDAQPGAEGHEIGTTPPPVTPRPQSPDTDVPMATQDTDVPMTSSTQDTDVPMATQSTDVPMASQQTVRPAKRPVDPDEDTLMTDAPPTKRRHADPGTLPPPPPPASPAAAGGHRDTDTGARGFGSLPSPPPPVVERAVEPMDLDTPPRSPAVESMDLDTPPPSPAAEQRPVDGDGDVVMQAPVEQAPVEQAPVSQPSAGQPSANPPQGAADRGQKRGREEDEAPVEGPDAKRRRTPAYENSSAVMTDRGYDRIDPQHPLTGELVNYIGSANKLHPPMSNSLLEKVNPHRTPSQPGAGFRPGDDLMACLENVEAYRDTHFGRPRVSGRTVDGTVEPIPGNTLWKRHDGPALFGQGADGVRKLMDQVRAGGPGSFATVLGIGASGNGHAVALVHDRDGTLRWADLTDRKVTVADGSVPHNYGADWTVWASVADPHENNVSGPHDPQFMERFSTFTGSADRPDPMDVDTFGTPHRDDPDTTDQESLSDASSSTTRWEDALESMSLSERSSSPVWEDAVERQFPPVGPRVPVAKDGLCLLRSITVSTSGPAGGGRTVEQLRSTVEDHFGALPPEQWPTEIVSNHRNDLIARNALGPGNPLGLHADALRTLGEHAAGNPPLPTARERAALLETVRNWDARWGSAEGEMLPAAAAHALGLSLRVVGHDGAPRAVLGPVDGQPVTLYHRDDHYDGSGPAEPAAHTTPEPEPTTDGGKAADPESEPAPVDPVDPKGQLNPKNTGPRPIAGDDLVLGLTGHETAVRAKVVEVMAAAVPGDRAEARAFADAYFGPATLRPMLGALSRGEVWTAPFEKNGWSGSIRLSGEVIGSTHRGTEKIEFEDGADRTVVMGTAHDAQWQSNIGVQARHSAGIAEPSELVGYFHDRGEGEVDLALGGMVARSKTSETADVFESKMRLELDFGDLRHDGSPVRTGSARTETVDLGMTVAVPPRADAGSVGELRTPPQRLLDGRVGGQEIVLDLAPRDSADQQPVAALLDRVEAAGQREFGEKWPELREKVLAEVDFNRLQQNLKSMTAGEPVTVALTDRHGRTVASIDITARVGELKQTGTTKETEFNIGTTVQQVHSTVTNRGHAGQLGVGNVFKPGGGALLGGNTAGRLGQDRITIEGDNRTAQLTSKSKVPGVRYEGPVHFDLAFNGQGVVHAAGSADVRLLVDRADTTEPVAAAEPKAPEAQKAPEAPKEQKAPEPQETPAPPESVWRGGDETGGLGESVVVRDVEGTAALRAAVDAKGRQRFGAEWDGVRDHVLRGLSQPNMAARLTGMTRGEPLQVKIPGKEDLVVTATARVESMTYRREDGKAELNTVSETGAFSVDRSLLSRTVMGTGQLGGPVAKGTPGADLVATGSSQQRERAGGQGRQADRVYASGKYGAPQVIYGTRLAVDVHFGRPGEAATAAPDVSAPVRVEVGMDARDTVKVQARRGEDGTVDFGPPGKDAEPTAGEGAKSTAGEGSSAPKPEATHTAPRRMLEQHELNASYVVHTLSGADKVRTTVEELIRAKHGEPADEVNRKIDSTFERGALKAKLSQLTRGGKLTETVSGKTWTAEITVTARVEGATYHSATDKYEFESGTRTSSGQGSVHDLRNRHDGGGQFRFRTPVVNGAGGYTHRFDRSYGQGVETVGSASNRGKHVEPAVLFDVKTAYDVKVEFKRLGVADGSVTRPVGAVARVAVPTRDAEPVGGATARTTEKQPQGFVEGRRLDSSAIVTDVHALPGTHTGDRGRTLGESLLSQVESGWKPGRFRRGGERPDGAPKLVRNPFADDWSGIRRELDGELTPDRLQARLKGMTAGDEIVVRHGRTEVRVSAVLRDRLEHLGDSGTTEFNTGTDVQRSFAGSGGSGNSHQGLFGLTGAVPVGAAPVSVTLGATGTGGSGHEHADVRTSSTAAGSATKAKLPGSAYRGEAELQFTITRRPWFGPSVHQRRTAVVGFETLVETGETVPVAAKPDAATAPPRTVPAEAPAPVTVRIPPRRVWETGLRDTDVLRFLDDAGGVQDLLRLRGPEYFGRSAWQEMAPVVGTVAAHSHVSALFGTASQGAEIAASVPTGRLSLGGGKGVELGLKVVSLEHRTDDRAVESSPANTTSSGGSHADLSARNAGLQGQVGASVTGDVTHNAGITGGAQRLWREGGSHADTGQTVSNGKYSVPMARYRGAAEVEVTFFDNDRKPVTEKGVVPFTVDIPLAETTASEVPGDHYLAFTGDRRDGELRFGENARLLEDVHRTLAADGDTAPFDHTARTPAEREQLAGTVRLGRAVYGGEFTAGTAAGEARIRAVHRLVELGGGTSTGASALLGDLLRTPEGTATDARQARQVLDHLARRTADGPVTLDDLYEGARDGWSAQQPYEVHRETWTDHGPASELVTTAMATAVDALAPLLRDAAPGPGQLHLTVSGTGPELPLHREFPLDGDPADRIREIEQDTYLKPGTRPNEVTVRVAGKPGSGQDWDYRVTARADRSRELTLRHRTPAEATSAVPEGAAGAEAGQQAEAARRAAAAARVDALRAFTAGLGKPPEASA